MEEMKALVEPLPLVPAMCIRFSRSRSDGCQSSQPSCVCGRLGLAVTVEAQTSYPSFRHHSIILGIESLAMALPDFLTNSTIAKLLCKVLRAATAS